MGQSFFDLEERREFVEDMGRRHERFPYELKYVASEATAFFNNARRALAEVSKGANPDEVKIDTFKDFSRCLDVDNLPHYLEVDEFDIHTYMDELYADENRGDTYFPAPRRSDLWPAVRNSEQDKRQRNSIHGRSYTEGHITRINKKPRHLREFSGRFMEVFDSLFVGNGFRHLSTNLNFLMKGEGMEYRNNAFVLSEEDEAQFLASVESVDYLGLRDIPKIPNYVQNWFFTNGWSRQHPAYSLNFDDSREPLIAFLQNAIFGQAYREGELLIVNQEGVSVLGNSNRNSHLEHKLVG